jgi:hypothetical protein
MHVGNGLDTCERVYCCILILSVQENNKAFENIRLNKRSNYQIICFCEKNEGVFTIFPFKYFSVYLLWYLLFILLFFTFQFFNVSILDELPKVSCNLFPYIDDVY